jgi:hypothetical protein
MSDSAKPEFTSYEEFWDFYVSQHSNKTNRRLHFVGTSLAMACVAGGALFKKPSLFLLAPVFGYGFAWFGHFVFEKNKPASFDHPVWSLKSDFVMWRKIANGTMDAEVERVMSGRPARADASHEVANGAPVDATVN